MPAYKSVYEIKEDSTLLESYVRQYAKGSVLDIGTGSGIQAIAAANNKNVNSVLATDIQQSVIEHCKKNIKNSKVTYLVSDLFQTFKKNKNLSKIKFDSIIFNPPYLPAELKIKDLTIEGGKKGYEVLETFFNDVNDFLKTDGIILIIFSSLTKKEKVDEFISKILLEYEILEKQHYFFEDLYVYLIKKSSILKKLEKNNIKNLKYFSRGKRGFIFTGKFKNKKVAIKIKNPKSEAISRIENEANSLKLLNKHKIGPRLLFYGKDFLVYKFVEGEYILDFLNKISLNKKSVVDKSIKKIIIKKGNIRNKINVNKKIISKMIKNIFEQLFVMDKLKINKEEMSHPFKHILIDKKNKPIFIDFERSRYTLKPGNVTQFCDFLISNNFITILKSNKIKINRKKTLLNWLKNIKTISIRII